MMLAEKCVCIRFQLDDGNCCYCDKMSIWDGEDTLIAELDGCDDPTGLIYKAYSGEMWVKFSTDEYNENAQRGFLAEVSID